MRSPFIAVLVLVASGGGVAAATVLGSEGGAPSPPVIVTHEEPFEVDALAPGGGPVEVHPVSTGAAANPRWGVRTYQTLSGLTCVNAGRIHDGRFGRADAGGAFVELPAAADGACADLGHAPLAFSIRRYEDAQQPVLVYGVASDRVEAVRFGPEGERDEVALERDGTFIITTDDADLESSELVVALAGGDQRRYPLDP